ncbi:hypothetical protein [Streptosporangium longisporum]|uniref:Uncharacterized protein n=1 Tax=Streptosporangium longisporum TaxID=46187 RepID=A0ABN3Y5M2_9ACTN
MVLCGAMLAPALLAGGLLAVELTGYEAILRSAIADPDPGISGRTDSPQGGHGEQESAGRSREGAWGSDGLSEEAEGLQGPVHDGERPSGTTPHADAGSGDALGAGGEEEAPSGPDNGALAPAGGPALDMAAPVPGAVAVVPVVVGPVPDGLFRARLVPSPLRPDQVYGGWVLVAAGADGVDTPHEIGATDPTGDLGDAPGNGGEFGSGGPVGADSADDAGGAGEPVGGTPGMAYPDAFVPVRIHPGSTGAHRRTGEESAMPFRPWLERVVPVAEPRVMRTVPVPPWRERSSPRTAGRSPSEGTLKAARRAPEAVGRAS